jgi:hypothetical protein
MVTRKSLIKKIQEHPVESLRLVHADGMASLRDDDLAGRRDAFHQ